MLGLPLAFAAPAVLAALVGLVGLYFLLRLTPPSPRQEIFPPLRLLIGLDPNETTPALTPWPILALRLAIGALIILAMAEPLLNSLATLSGSGPLLILMDDGFAAAPEELRLRVLAKAIAKAAPPTEGAYPLRLERLEALIEALAGANLPIRRTLGGAVITLGPRGPVSVTAEGPRRRGNGSKQTE